MRTRSPVIVIQSYGWRFNSSEKWHKLDPFIIALGPRPYHAHGNNGKKIAVPGTGKSCKYTVIVIGILEIFIMELNNGAHSKIDRGYSASVLPKGTKRGQSIFEQFDLQIRHWL